jgi:hypothetical protein
LNAISENRLTPYHPKIESVNDLTCYGRYLWNTALSESLYPSLHGLEVTLRNNIHNAITQELGQENWFDHILAEPERKVLEEIKGRLTRQRRPLDIGQLVASSSFGFWVSLLNRRYENVLWAKLLKPICPYMPNREPTRNTLSHRLNRIRELRNRVFHHKPIWHRSHWIQNHEDLLETIS